jgi:hypothetical protein
MLLAMQMRVEISKIGRLPKVVWIGTLCKLKGVFVVLVGVLKAHEYIPETIAEPEY